MRDVAALDLRARSTEAQHSLLLFDAEVCRRFPDFRGCLARNATEERVGTWHSSCEQYVAFLPASVAAPVYVDPGSVSGATPGLLYNASHSFPVIKAGHHWRLKTWNPCASVLRTPEVRHDQALAVVVQEYTCAVAHLVYETLPKFALLLLLLDARGLLGRVRFLLPVCALGMRRFFDELMTPTQRRVAQLDFTWTPAARHASTVGVWQVGYVGTFATPFEKQVWDVRSGGAPPTPLNSLGWCPSCAALRHASHRTLRHEEWYERPAHGGMRCKIIVLQRGDKGHHRAASRSIANLPEVLDALANGFPAFNVSSFTVSQARSPLREMHDAAVLVAPHGAGLSNVYLMPRRALVVELAYTGAGRGMEFPASYYHLWSHGCNLTHTLALARGSYGTPMTADLQNLRAVLGHAIQQSPAHSHCARGGRGRAHKPSEVLLRGRYSGGVR